jgi:hypothetical protein
VTTLSEGAEVSPDASLLGVGLTSASADVYYGTSTITFGTGGSTLVSSGSGDLFGFQASVEAPGTEGYLAVTAGYTSGSPLSGTATFDNTTIAALGLTTGTYTVTWGNGTPFADSLTVNIGISSVPEPSTLALGGIAVVAGLVLARRQRHAA